MGLAFYSPVVAKPQQIGLVIRAAREKRGMSQEALAHLAGTNLNSVSQIELGKRNPGWETLARIAAVLRIPPDDLAPAIEYEMQAARERDPNMPMDPLEREAMRRQDERTRKRNLDKHPKR